MDCKRFSTAEGGYALCRRLSICMLSVGLVAWVVPVAAQDDAASSPCANGIVVPDPQDHPGLVADCEVLLGLHDLVVASPYGREQPITEWYGWSTELPITEWNGVVVSDSRVSELYLHDNYSISQEREDSVFIHFHPLTGPIPAELGQLKNLTHLYLSGNALTGPIPPEWGQLKNLTHLDLGFNLLTGPIPTELGQLKNLTHLELGGNALALIGSIPPELTQLKNLTHLGLSRNQLTGSIPPELTQLKNLTHLDLGFNLLTGPIPIELTQLTKLRSLGLAYNELTGPIPTELGQLIKLEYLYLGGNQLTGPMPTELTHQLTKLEHLGLEGNQWTCVSERREWWAWEWWGWSADLPICKDDTAVESTVLGNLPTASGLDPNFPNPFNAHTQIPYRLATPGPVQLVVYNLLGQPVRTLVDQVQTIGWYQVPWDARDQRGNAVSAGVYLACLHYLGGVQTQRLLYLK